MSHDPSDPLIDAQDARRLCIALIGAHQQDLIRQNKMSRASLVTSVLSRDGQSAGNLSISEDTLEIDSLGLLDLVMKVNQFFGLDATGIEDFLFLHRTLDDWSNLIAEHFTRVGQDAQITFSTSGSTDQPTQVCHTRHDLDTEIATIAKTLFDGIGETGHVLAAVPPHNIYGFLWSVLLPRHLGRSCLDLHTAAPTAILRNASPGDIVVATPYLWERYATFGLQFPEGIIGVSSGGPARVETWDAAQTVGLDRLIEVYGSTETGGLGWRSDRAAALTLFPHLERHGANIHRAGDASPCPIQDALSWRGDRAFVVEGRKDRVVQIAGTNVNLDHVEHTLCETGLAKQAAVRPDGARLKAFIVPDTDASEDLEQKIRAALLVLPAVARPDQLTFGAELPKTAVGKLSDW